MISLSTLMFMKLVFFYSDFQIRLTGHNMSHAGRVEVLSHGIWGRVEHTYWNNNSAAVVCRQLGFPGVATALRYSAFGEGSGPMMMSNVRCVGTENFIEQCQYVDWMKTYAYIGREAGVVCKTFEDELSLKDFTIRLQGSSLPNTGRVEVSYAGIWGGISLFNWNIEDAHVACRQLGYQAGAEAALTNGIYGPVSGPVWLTNVRCTGNESNLMSCSHDGIGKNSETQRREDVAGVICNDTAWLRGISMRLRRFHSLNVGRVEVFFAGRWGSVYAVNWDINDAKVVCRQLGYRKAVLARRGGSCSGAAPSWFTHFGCYGNETSLDQCTRSFATNRNTYCANVICDDGFSGGFEVRLRGSQVHHAGTVEIRIKGLWGSITSLGLSFFDGTSAYDLARALCRQLNFTNVLLLAAYSNFGSGTGLEWVNSSGITCPGNATDIESCELRGQLEQEFPNEHQRDIGVVCKPDVPQTNDFQVRLVGSSLPYAGTIEVLHYGVWGGILGLGFADISVGHVVCRQLGYPGAEKIFQYSSFGSIKGPLWIQQINCIGNETDISQCTFSTCDNTHDSRYCLQFQDPRYATAVICNVTQPNISEALKVRLAGAPISNAGRVEVYYARLWGTVSGSSWDINDAHVICRQLGYPGAISYGRSNQFGTGTGPVWFCNVRCLGNETTFNGCVRSFDGRPNGFVSSAATVLCKVNHQAESHQACAKAKCENNGTCISIGVGVICSCTEGFTGLHCEIMTVDPCDSSPCQKGGRCFSSGSSYHCSCPKVVTGQNCELAAQDERDPCESSPCADHAICYHNQSSFVCVPVPSETSTNNKGTGEQFENPQSKDSNTTYVVALSALGALVLVVSAAVVYLLCKNRRVTEPPNKTEPVFPNKAFEIDSYDDLYEVTYLETNRNGDVDLGNGVHSQPPLPLPPLPPLHKIQEKQVKNHSRQKNKYSKPNQSGPVYENVTSPAQENRQHKATTQGTGTKPDRHDPGVGGTETSAYMSLSPGVPKGSTYSSLKPSLAPTSGTDKHGKGAGGESYTEETYENVGFQRQ